MQDMRKKYVAHIIWIGGGGGIGCLSLRIADPLYYIEISIFGDGPKIYLKRLRRHYILNLKKKAISKKCLRMLFLTVFSNFDRSKRGL